ncbi:MAG: alginate lyase family protein [Planctomycetota bacterium]
MTLGRLFRRALELPPHIAARKAVRLGIRHWQRRRDRQRDRTTSTYSALDSQVPRLARLYDPWSLDALVARRAEIDSIADLYLSHRFDLLGSGWTQWNSSNPELGGPAWRGSDAGAGFPVSPAQRTDAERRARLIRDASYSPIDWQRDVKSGVRWDPRTWHRDVAIFVPGADVKVPWELGRMQHLLWLAAAHQLASSGPNTSARSTRLADEFSNQIADFMIANPPRFGVQWVCPMDVALRAVSWLVAYDLFRATGAEFDSTWTSCFVASLRDHGRFILQHLEWEPAVRGNHYLANVCGLAYLAAYLPVDAETETWMRFGVQELLAETQLQFGTDGVNFEASTSYHRLAAEMVTQTTRLLLALPEEKCAVLAGPFAPGRVGPVTLERAPLWPLRDDHFTRLAAIARFSEVVSCGDWAPRIGDDDSGYFLRWLPRHEAGPAALDAPRAPRDPVPRQRGDGGFEPAAGAGEIHWVSIPASHYEVCQVTRDLSVTRSELPSRPRRCVALAAPASVTPPSVADVEGCEPLAFPAAGFYVMRSASLHCVFRAGPNGQNGNGGHAHNDQLSFTLTLGGQPLIVDPGSYVYSPDPAQRNRFRSTAVHSTLVFDDREQNSWDPGVDGLFRLRDRAQGRVTRFSGSEVVGEHRGFGVLHRRSLRFETAAICGVDWVAQAGRLAAGFPCAAHTHVELVSSNAAQLEFPNGAALLEWTDAEGRLEVSHLSPSYGVLTPISVVRLLRQGQELRWRLSWRLR